MILIFILSGITSIIKAVKPNKKISVFPNKDGGQNAVIENTTLEDVKWVIQYVKNAKAVIDEQKGTGKNMITNKEFTDAIVAKLHNIEKIFLEKNDQYGNEDPLANFTAGAYLMYGSGDMNSKYKALLSYVAKHIAHVYNNDLNGNKISESINDIAVYFIIASAMADLKEK